MLFDVILLLAWIERSSPYIGSSVPCAGTSLGLMSKQSGTIGSGIRHNKIVRAKHMRVFCFRIVAFLQAKCNRSEY